jgi:hypothetical protein
MAQETPDFYEVPENSNYADEGLAFYDKAEIPTPDDENDSPMGQVMGRSNRALAQKHICLENQQKIHIAFNPEEKESGKHKVLCAVSENAVAPPDVVIDIAKGKVEKVTCASFSQGDKKCDFRNGTCPSSQKFNVVEVEMGI